MHQYKIEVSIYHDDEPVRIDRCTLTAENLQDAARRYAALFTSEQARLRPQAPSGLAQRHAELTNLASYAASHMYDPPRNSRLDDLLREARDWIADCFSDVDVASLDDTEIREGVERHYEGGWAAFAAASTTTWFAASKAAGCTGTGFNAKDDTIEHRGEMPCPVHPGL